MKSRPSTTTIFDSGVGIRIEMKMKDFRDKYPRHKTFIESNCVICNDDMLIPKSFKDSIKTCSRECSNIKIALQKMKGIYVQCDMCDRAIYLERKKISSKNKTGKHFCSKDCLKLYYQTVEFLGGREINPEGTSKKYYGKNWRKQRRKARERDGYACKTCGITEKDFGKEMSVNHIVPFVYFSNSEDANCLDNLECLCEPCHRKWHSGIEHPANFEKDKIKNNGAVKVKMEQKELAKKVVRCLLETNLTLVDISRDTGMSYTGVSRIYHGKRWKELYEIPAIKTNPRAKSKILHQSIV